MDQFIGRQEFDDLIRYAVRKVEAQEARLKSAFEEIAAQRVAITAAHFSIRLLGRLLQQLLPAEQRELLELESRAGIVDSALGDEREREPNDGDEWRRRLERESLARREQCEIEAQHRATISEDQVAAWKALGSAFVIQSDDEGPCYNRDEKPPSML